MGEHEGGDTVLRRQSSGDVHLVQGMRYRPGVDEVIGARAGSETGNMSGIITGESIALQFPGAPSATSLSTLRQS